MLWFQDNSFGNRSFNPIQDGQKGPPTSFSPVTSTKKVFFLLKFLQNWGHDNFSHRNARVA